jgi:hypothetical protein
MQGALAADGPFWREHGYDVEDSSYFSYVHELKGGPQAGGAQAAGSTLELYIRHVQRLAAAHWPEVLKARFAEWCAAGPWGCWAGLGCYAAVFFSFGRQGSSMWAAARRASLCARGGRAGCPAGALLLLPLAARCRCQSEPPLQPCRQQGCSGSGRAGDLEGGLRGRRRWAHCRLHPSGHQLHFDSENEGRGKVRGPCRLQAPALSWAALAAWAAHIPCPPLPLPLLLLVPCNSAPRAGRRPALVRGACAAWTPDSPPGPGPGPCCLPAGAQPHPQHRHVPVRGHRRPHHGEQPTAPSPLRRSPLYCPAPP